MKSQKFDYEPFEIHGGCFGGRFGPAAAKHALVIAKGANCLVRIDFH